MKEIIFNRKDYKSYKDFYTQIYKDLDGNSISDWEDYQDLCYSADALNEFLWYYHNDNIKYIFVNFDKEKISLQKNFDDYKYNIIIDMLHIYQFKTFFNGRQQGSRWYTLNLCIIIIIYWNT